MNPPPPAAPAAGPWYAELSRYHWWVLAVATLGWLFDSMDQRLFVLARSPAIRTLVSGASDAEVAGYAGSATSIFILGWATGGLVFGLFGDRWGRARTMALTILIYSAFTGLSACAVGWYDFAAYRFLCGLGIGGEYAAGVALVAEVMPRRARPYCLGLLQGLAALGHVVGSLVSLAISPQGVIAGIEGWRLLLAFGVAPSLLAVVIRRRLREPDSWVQAKNEAARAAAQPSPANSQADELNRRLGDWREIVHNRTLRWHVVIGMGLGICGQIGLWGIGYWTPELIRGAQRERRMAALAADAAHAASEAGAPLPDLAEIARRTTDGPDAARATEQRWRADDDRLVAWGTVLQDIAGMCGIYAFTFLTTRVGRRPAFAASYALAYGATLLTFTSLRTESDVYWMLPLLGFCISSVYGGFAIYFPELFPTRLRSTGTGLCYNVARYVTAFGPLLLGRLTLFFAAGGAALPLRSAAVALATAYLVGLAVTWFAPETHGRPMPD